MEIEPQEEVPVVYNQDSRAVFGHFPLYIQSSIGS